MGQTLFQGKMAASHSPMRQLNRTLPERSRKDYLEKFGGAIWRMKTPVQHSIDHG
jgi:hypothetical protein